MKDLKNISRLGEWKDSADTLNYNFSTLGSNIGELLEDTQRCKGLYPSLSDLKTKNPDPENGSWAYVGTAWPAKIYVYLDNQWVDTRLTGSLDVDLERYLNKVDTSSIYNLFKTEITWIYKSNHTGWSNLTGTMSARPEDDATYVIRPKSLKFGEEGELLERSTTDAYLMEFKRGSDASFVSAVITSSDGVEKRFTGGQLTWTIDQSYFFENIGGRRTQRPPVRGDSIRVEFKYKDLLKDEYAVNQYFKFV